jgi:hypothetical protein
LAIGDWWIGDSAIGHSLIGGSAMGNSGVTDVAIRLGDGRSAAGNL